MSDIANKGEAERCRDLAIQFLNAKQYDKAIRFFEKSLKLYPLTGISELIKKAEALSKASSSSSNTNNSSSESKSNNSNSTKTTNSSENTRPYTDEQESGAKKLLALFKKSHYDALGVSKNSSEAEIKKAYRKLALKFHPDKNSAPSAENAFKALNTAFECLSDPRKKEIYDAYGAEASEQMAHDSDNGRAHGFRRGGGGFHNADISPEDLLNMFFNGAGGPRMRFNRFNQQQHHHQETRERQRAEPTNPIQQILQLLPVLMLILMSLSNFTGSSQPSFSFYMQTSYPISKTTSTIGKDINYFVPKGFDEKFRGKSNDLKKFEKTVEAEYAEVLSTSCLNERGKKHRNLQIARRMNNKNQIEEIQKQALKYCDEFNELFGKDRKYKNYINVNHDFF